MLLLKNWMGNGVATLVRSKLETTSEYPLTEHEEIINYLYEKVEKLKLQLEKITK